MHSHRHPLRRLRFPLALAGFTALAVGVGLALRVGVALGATHAALGDSLDGGFSPSRGVSPSVALILVLALAGAGLVSATVWRLAHGRREPARVTVRDPHDGRRPGDRRA